MTCIQNFQANVRRSFWAVHIEVNLLNQLIFRFLYYATGLDDMAKLRKAIFMFVDLFGLERYNFEKLVNKSQYFIVVTTCPPSR